MTCPTNVFFLFTGGHLGPDPKLVVAREKEREEERRRVEASKRKT